MESKFFKAEEVAEGVTCISGLGGVNCYLVQGSQKALLIDGLTGAGSLKAFVRELTDLPVTLVNTHGHVDHIGADFEYKEVYISASDIPLLYEHSDIEMRYGYGKRSARFDYRIEDVCPACPVKTYPLNEGDVFDLGGVKLETIAVPGHTRGTLVFLDAKAGILYSGDACNISTLLYGEEATSIEEYKESLIHLNSYRGSFSRMLGGHGKGFAPAEMIDEAIELCDEIMNGTDDAVLAKGIQGQDCWYAKEKNQYFQRIDGGMANIAYAKNRIWKKDIQ